MVSLPRTREENKRPNDADKHRDMLREFILLVSGRRLLRRDSISWG